MFPAYYTPHAILTIAISEWIVENLDPSHNALSWVAGAAGAFVIRFAYPNLPLKVSFGGWLAGFILACLFAPTVSELPQMHLIKPVAVWGALGLIGDLLIQLIGFLMRLGSKVGGDVVANPGQAVDAGIIRRRQGRRYRAESEKYTARWAA